METINYKIFQVVKKDGEVVWDVHVKKIKTSCFGLCKKEVWCDLHNKDYFDTKELAEKFVNDIEVAKTTAFYIDYHHS